MILLWIALLSTPLDAWLLRTRCVARQQIEALVTDCDTALRSTTKQAIVARPSQLDAGVLAQLLGAPTTADGWQQFPKTLAADAGRCAVAMRAGESAPLTLRLTASKATAATWPAEPRCPSPTDLDLLVTACGEAWSEEVDDTLALGPMIRWSPAPGVEFERRPYGLEVRFARPSITGPQLEPVFGVGVGSSTRTVHRAPPPITATGRRCEAEAYFAGGRLKMLMLIRAAQWRPAAQTEVHWSSDAARAQVQAMEAVCKRGHAVREREQVGSWLALDAVRLPDLMQRFGSGEMMRHQRDLDELVVWDARYRFAVTPTCAIEVEVLDLIAPVHRARLRWRAGR